MQENNTNINEEYITSKYRHHLCYYSVYRRDRSVISSNNVKACFGGLYFEKGRIIVITRMNIVPMQDFQEDYLKMLSRAHDIKILDNESVEVVLTGHKPIDLSILTLIRYLFECSLGEYTYGYRPHVFIGNAVKEWRKNKRKDPLKIIVEEKKKYLRSFSNRNILNTGHSIHKSNSNIDSLTPITCRKFKKCINHQLVHSIFNS